VQHVSRISNFAVMIISLIAAIDKNNAIGKDNQLMWRIRDDLKLFKRTTLNHVIVMGRKSYESIGKPLSNRTNVVVTRKRDYQPEGVLVFHSLDAVFEHYEKTEDEIFVIGGGEIYRQSLDNAHMLHISHIDVAAEAPDTYFPKVKWEEWKSVYEESYEKSDVNDHAFRYVMYERVSD
jgi:dihydrofolate reductase